MKQGISPEAGIAAMWLSVFIGTAAGSILTAFVPDADIAQNVFLRQGMGTAMSACGLGRTFLELCGIPLFWLLCTGIVGTSLAGKPLAFGFLFWRGTALGAVLCDIYMMQGAAGLLTAFLFAAPYAMTGTFLFLLGTREAIRFSSALFCHVSNGSGEVPPPRLYVLRFLVTAGFLLLAGILQCIWLRAGYPAFLEIMAG